MGVRVIKRDELNLRFREAPTVETLRALGSSLDSTFWFPLPRVVWEAASVGLKHLLGRKERVRLYCLLAERARLARMTARTAKQTIRLEALNLLLEGLQRRLQPAPAPATMPAEANNGNA